MVQVVSRRPLIADVPIRSQVSPYEICGRHSDTVTCLSLSLSPSTSVSTVSTVPPFLHNHHLRTVLSKGQAGGSLGGLEESIALPYVGEHISKISHLRTRCCLLTKQ